MKNTVYVKLLLIAIFSLSIVSCDQDDSIEYTDPENFTQAEVTEETITVSEGEDISFTISQEELVVPKVDFWEAYWAGFDEVSGQVGIRVVGGTATEGVDYTINLWTIQDFSPFLLQDGYYYGYDASTELTHVVSNIIDVVEDGEAEGPETIELQLFPVALGYVIIDDTITITITD